MYREIKRVIGLFRNMTIPLSSAVQTSMTARSGPGELPIMDGSAVEATRKNGPFFVLEFYEREGISRVEV